MGRLTSLLAAVSLAVGFAPLAAGSGTLTPKGTPDRTIQILDHHVDVVINNGFSRTEVHQTFFNPNGQDLEAVYAFPVPKSACLAEMTIFAGESELHGEVVEKGKARQIYEDERDKGNDSGLAEKNGFQTFEFSVSPVRAQSETSFRFVYYQRLEIDTGVGRYVYPLEEGGTDEAALQFWTTQEKVERSFSMNIELKSAWPVDRVRMPGFEAAAVVDMKDSGHAAVRLELQDTFLDRDFVLYYKLADDLPGRVEVIPYRSEADRAGSFMMVVTPGVDLQPLTGGADYVFVVDTSGSMQGKIHTVADGVTQALGALKPEDRFHVVTFNNQARSVTRGFVPATLDNVTKTIKTVESLKVGGGTNLYDGVSLALKGLDADRATSIVLITDAVANQGEVSPQAFAKLMKKYDVRVFGFLMGNGANWPLMRVLCDVSGGFYAGVSNADDIVGQILLAKSKITYECLHDADLSIKGVKTYDTTDGNLGKVYRGQQLVFFGRYADSGPATVTLKARLTGEDKTYKTRFNFPAVATDNPEIERLWAMDRIEAIQHSMDVGAQVASEGEQAIADLGVNYQLVTDHTSMLVLNDTLFDSHSIQRHNRERVAKERQAQTVRASQPAKNHRVDREEPMFNKKAPSSGGGGGALDPFTLCLVLGAGALSLGARRRR